MDEAMRITQTQEWGVENKDVRDVVDEQLEKIKRNNEDTYVQYSQIFIFLIKIGL